MSLSPGGRFKSGRRSSGALEVTTDSLAYRTPSDAAFFGDPIREADLACRGAIGVGESILQRPVLICDEEAVS